jgi:hypothetical protein
MLPGSLSLYPDALPARINPAGYGRNMSLFLLMKRCGIWRRMVCVGFEVLRAVALRVSIFWEITPCSPLEVASRGSASDLLHACFLLCIFLNPEDGGYMFLQNVG